MKPTLSAFVESSNIPPALIRAVARQLGGWESFKESAHAIANHGIDGGFHGFIYYWDTLKFAKRNKVDILSLCKETAESFGNDGVISFISGFNFLQGYTQDEIAYGLYNPKSEEATPVYNALAWFAGEEVARAYDDWRDSE